MVFQEYKDQTIFITGGGSGIGLAQVKAFLTNGARVFVLDIVVDQLVPLQENYPNELGYFQASVCDREKIQQAVSQAIEKFHQIDILLNTAGVLDQYAKTLETEESLWDHIMNTNVKGMYMVTNAVLPYMLQKKHGVIVNMASIAGLVAGGGGAAYTTSKHAVIGYTKQLAHDYCREGIRVNALAPGAIETPMNQADFAGDGEMAKWVAEETPAKRWAKPEEVANATLFLASKAADYIHGTVLPIDGGWIMK